MTGHKTDSTKPEHYFDNATNMGFALETVEKMAEKCKEYIASCYGVGVLNEPMPGTPTPTSDSLHTFLAEYYPQAILAARKHLDASVPVVLFSWVFDFHRWSD